MGQMKERSASDVMEDNMKKAFAEMILLFLLSEKDWFISELASEVQKRSNGALVLVFPYSTIYRMEENGYILELGNRIAPDGRRRRYHGITESGRSHLEVLLTTYKRFTRGLADVLTKERKDDEQA